MSDSFEQKTTEPDFPNRIVYFLALTFVALGILNSILFQDGMSYGEELQGSKNLKLEHSLLNGFIRLYSH